MRRLVWFAVLMSMGFVACGGGGGQGGLVRTFNSVTTTVQTGQTSTTVAPGGSAGVISVNWLAPFPTTDYTVACTPKLVSGPAGDLSAVIASKSTTGVQVLIQFNNSATVQVNCIAIPDASGNDLRHARASFNSPGANQPSIQSLTWSTPFGDPNYTPVCSVVAAVETVPLTEHIHATSLSDVTAWINFVTSAPQPFEVDCIGVPDSTTSGIHHGRAEVIELSASPVNVSMNWDTPFADLNYVPVCDTLFVSGTELPITTNADGSTTSSQIATVNWQTNDGRGTVGCIASTPTGQAAVTPPVSK